MQVENHTHYPMNDKWYFIIYKGDVIAFGKCIFDNVKYILFQFHAIRKDGLFHHSFDVDQTIRFRRPFEGFNFTHIDKDEKPFKKPSLKFYVTSTYLRNELYAKKKTK